MANIRSVRALAAVAALPLAVGLFAGVAQADTGGFADGGSNASVATISGSGSGSGATAAEGGSSTTQQVATGQGASNENHTTSVDGSGFTALHQGTTVVNFAPFW
ncbi:hypothetical protein ACLGI4_14880 [Streptomyces sp. HMX112]|uniref:hypothetical protein n=1 Tax=Streptomyces sp. HMX112 TaxID=3390850 RepID=UPI003A7F9834